jgi:hypothetical protein
MSWDIFVQDIPASISSVHNIADDYDPKPIGTRSHIIAQIQALHPIADFSDPSWGKLDGKNFSIELNMGDKEVLDGFTFHVRGGDEAAKVVKNILIHLGLRAFDPASETGIFQTASDPAVGLRS